MSNEMVERVARAIADELEMARNWPDYVASARAAIAAMREPSGAMMVAGHNVRNVYGTDEIYTAMIDAALNEPGSDRTV